MCLFEEVITICHWKAMKLKIFHTGKTSEDNNKTSGKDVNPEKFQIGLCIHHYIKVTIKKYLFTEKGASRDTEYSFKVKHQNINSTYGPISCIYIILLKKNNC